MSVFKLQDENASDTFPCLQNTPILDITLLTKLSHIERVSGPCYLHQLEIQLNTQAEFDRIKNEHFNDHYIEPPSVAASAMKSESADYIAPTTVLRHVGIYINANAPAQQKEQGTKKKVDVEGEPSSGTTTTVDTTASGESRHEQASTPTGGWTVDSTWPSTSESQGHDDVDAIPIPPSNLLTTRAADFGPLQAQNMMIPTTEGVGPPPEAVADPAALLLNFNREMYRDVAKLTAEQNWTAAAAAAESTENQNAEGGGATAEMQWAAGGAEFENDDHDLTVRPRNNDDDGESDSDVSDNEARRVIRPPEEVARAVKAAIEEVEQEYQQQMQQLRSESQVLDEHLREQQQMPTGASEQTELQRQREQPARQARDEQASEVSGAPREGAALSLSESRSEKMADYLIRFDGLGSSLESFVNQLSIIRRLVASDNDNCVVSVDSSTRYSRTLVDKQDQLATAKPNDQYMQTSRTAVESGELYAVGTWKYYNSGLVLLGRMVSSNRPYLWFVTFSSVRDLWSRRAIQTLKNSFIPPVESGLVQPLIL